MNKNNWELTNNVCMSFSCHVDNVRFSCTLSTVTSTSEPNGLVLIIVYDSGNYDS